MPLIINHRASRVTLCQVPFRTKNAEGNEEVQMKDLVVLPAEQVKTDNGFRVEPSKTQITNEQAEAVRKHRACSKLFQAGVLSWAGEDGKSKKAA